MAPRLLVAALAIPGLVAAGAYAFVLADAGQAAFDVDQLLESAQPVPKSARDVLLAKAEWVPSDPRLQETIGVLEMREGDGALLADAGDRFAIALRRRPVSAQTWANVASQKYRVGDTGPAFEKAFLNAARLGPNEVGVQAILANYGLALWPDLGPEMQARTDAIVGRAIARDPKEIMQIAQRRGRLQVACRHFNSQPRRADLAKWAETCQSLEATS